MFSAGYILTALTAFAAVVSVAAVPADIEAREEVGSSFSKKGGNSRVI